HNVFYVAPIAHPASEPISQGNESSESHVRLATAGHRNERGATYGAKSLIAMLAQPRFEAASLRIECGASPPTASSSACATRARTSLAVTSALVGSGEVRLRRLK